MEGHGSESPTHWVHDLDPVIFQITESLAVRWYGLAYVASFAIAFALFHLYWRRGRSRLDPRAQESLALALVLGVVIGGRLGYFILYDLPSFIRDPFVLFRVWEGGMASHGGFIGAALACYWVARKHKLPWLHLGDLVATVTAQGLLLGRMANFINGELWGKVSDVPWAVVFPQSVPHGYPLHLIPPRHPSQLYQALLEGLLVFIYMQWRFWKRPPRAGGQDEACRASSPDGHLLGEFLIAYSGARIVGELFREPDASLLFGLSRGSFYSILLMLVGLGILFLVRKGKLTKRESL